MPSQTPEMPKRTYYYILYTQKKNKAVVGENGGEKKAEAYRNKRLFPRNVLYRHVSFNLDLLLSALLF